MVYLSEIFGIYGAEAITDTLTHTVNASAIQFIGSTVIDTLTTDTKRGFTGNTLDGATMTDGTWIYGHFTSLKLTSGMAIMYKKV
jgi:hypothetical protein